MTSYGLLISVLLALDSQTNIVYATIRQTFTIWLVPFSLWQANVRFVCVLQLEKRLVNIVEGEERWFIRGQEDHYQVNEFLKFIAPFGASVVYWLWQLFATILCAIGVAFLWPVTSVYECFAPKVEAKDAGKDGDKRS
jgi:hypothetical protein